MSAVEAVQLDGAKLEAFMGKVLEDLSGTMTTFFCSIGDRLGLFRHAHPQRGRSSTTGSGTTRLGLLFCCSRACSAMQRKNG